MNLVMPTSHLNVYLYWLCDVLIKIYLQIYKNNSSTIISTLFGYLCKGASSWQRVTQSSFEENVTWCLPCTNQIRCAL